MSPRTAVKPPVPAAASLAARTAVAIGIAVRDERQRRRWTTADVATRAHIAKGTVSGIEAGRHASLETYARLAVALGLDLRVELDDVRRRSSRRRDGIDIVHAAMGEWEARRLAARNHNVAIDHPYQHYQFAGRADVLSWTVDPPALLHIENRTRFPDLQEAAGSYNAKRQYLADVVARQHGLARFRSQTHVMVALWSAEVLHSIRLRQSTFTALCPDPDDRFLAWLDGVPPVDGLSSSFVLLDPFASGRQASLIGLERALAGVKPRVRDYREAARAAEGFQVGSTK
jgi:transcriptional regulator with XRE-family HTH domain